MRSLLVKTGILLSLIITGSVTASLGGWLGYQNLEKSARNELFRYTTLLTDLVSRYQVMTPVLASNVQFNHLLLSPSPRGVEEVNYQLEEIASYLKLTSDIYILNENGHTLASSNWNTDTSFIGRNFSFRPYFQQAMTGAQGFYYALGTTSKVRGIYFSSPIQQGERVLGVMVLKINVDPLEEIWQPPETKNTFEFLVTDKNSVVFLSSRSDWRYQSVKAISEKQMETIGYERRYLGIDILPMDITPLKQPAGLSDSVSAFKLADEEYIQIEMAMPQSEWNVSIFAKTSSVEYDMLSSMLSGLFFMASIIGAWLYLRERQARLEHLESSRRDLEYRVVQRTQDLEITNERLVQEIEERSRAEYQLKAAQDGLIQAAKLATLGQMSAGINHELNQPLTAIKTFSINATKFLERGKLDTVGQNLLEIRQLCDRMGKIISQFKLFSRKSSAKLVTIDLQQIIVGALYLVQPMLDRYQGKLERKGEQGPVLVAGDMVRLEQVMVNLLSNAIQATEAKLDSASIIVALHSDSEYAIIQVKDNGPGLVDTHEIFEPFFTTKEISEGLGLGLSISRQIIEAMNGTLIAKNPEDAIGHDEAGAIFEIRLPILIPHEDNQ